MDNLIGRFYFKLTDSKNLIGEFSNNHETCRKNYTEGAVLVSRGPNDGKFVGKYRSTWYDDEGDGESVLAELEIKPKANCENIFTLKWQLRGAKGNFWGEGMVFDGILIGDYRNFKDLSPTPQ